MNVNNNVNVPQKIFAMCGRKQSGKDSAVKFMMGLTLVQNKVIDSFELDSLGELYIPMRDTSSNEVVYSKVDIFDDLFVSNTINHVYGLALATPLKMAVSYLFGIDMNLLMGSDEDKNTPTQYKLSAFTNNKKGDDRPATIREILQNFSNKLWQINNDLFCERASDIISNVPSPYIFITDVRRLNEMQYLKDMGAILIKFTRAPFEDSHITENELDSYTNYNYIVDNANLSLEEKNKQLQSILINEGVISNGIGVI